MRLTVPAIGVETPLVRLGLEPDRTMQVPEDFGRAGWFAEGPAPGQPGPAVIAGHVDSRTGPAVFYRLRDLRPGDHIDVTRADRTRLRFVVDTTHSFPKTRFPTDAVFGPPRRRNFGWSPAPGPSTGPGGATATTLWCSRG